MFGGEAEKAVGLSTCSLHDLPLSFDPMERIPYHSQYTTYGKVRYGPSQA